jgi:hypothetical protein
MLWKSSVSLFEGTKNINSTHLPCCKMKHNNLKRLGLDTAINLSQMLRVYKQVCNWLSYDLSSRRLRWPGRRAKQIPS